MNTFQKYVGNLQILLTPESSGFILNRRVSLVADKNIRPTIGELIDGENPVYLSIDVRRHGIRGSRELEDVGVYVHNIFTSDSPKQSFSTTSRTVWYRFDNPLIRQQIFEEYWDQVESLELNPDE